MPRVPFDELPGNGRLWVFPASRDLDEAEAARLLDAVDDFLAQWAAHGVPLRSARELRGNRFLLVGVDVDAEAPSGCSIDALVRQLRELGASIDVSLVDHAPVWFRDGELVRTASRRDFRGLASSGSVTASTNVFDTSLTRVAEARDGLLERPAAETWHGRAFFKESVGS